MGEEKLVAKNNSIPDRIQAVWNILGGDEGVDRLLRGELHVSREDTPSLQSIFNPATFIGKGWSYAEPRDPRSATLGQIDYRKVKLSTDWLQADQVVNGEERRRRILDDTSAVTLNCDHFLDLWENKEKIPEEWKKVSYITFDGDALLHSDGYRNVLCLCWYGDSWDWDYDWLDDDFSGGVHAAVFAS
jgi:hypothetical protein